VEALPDLSTLSDTELRNLIDELEREENEISYRRRILHGKIDILRAELVARLKAEGETELGELDLSRLAAILSHKSAPTVPDDS
jgi:hypothetical protein